VQHHHAHAAAVMAENGVTGPVLAVVCDGTGLGIDQTIWGGELLIADLVGFKQLARLRPLRLPGGDAAAIDPRRSALAALALVARNGFEEHPAAVDLFPERAERVILCRMVRDNIGCAVSSGSGRWFDAAAALLGICTRASFEGQAPMALEAAAFGHDAPARSAAHPLFTLRAGSTLQIDLAPLLREMLALQSRGTPVGVLAALFHEQFARAWESVVDEAVERTGVRTIALSGGVFCNERLTCRLMELLTARRLTVLRHRLVPPNDGGIALGQAAIAAGRAARGLVPKAGA
jgi:hydrogenase maturation protein HypF